MKMKVSMAINDFVWVTLTEEGKRVARDNAEYGMQSAKSEWTKFHLLTLMQLFGPVIDSLSDEEYFGEIRLDDPNE